MLSKIEGARRIKYKGDELYIMVKSRARIALPYIYAIEDYGDDIIVVINGGVNGADFSVCASSDMLDDSIEIMAAYDEPSDSSDMQREWKPYNISPVHAALSSMAVTYSGLTEDDHLKFKKNEEKSAGANLLDFMKVATAAYQNLQVRAAINIFYNGLSDYAEAENDVYKETKIFSEWGTGEEGAAAPDGQPAQREERPLYLGFHQKDLIYLFQAIENPAWHDVPYIQLIAENDVPFG